MHLGNSFAVHIQKRHSADRSIADLIWSSTVVSWNPYYRPCPRTMCCESRGGKSSIKPQPFKNFIMFSKALFAFHISGESVTGAHSGIQIIHHDENFTSGEFLELHWVAPVSEVLKWVRFWTRSSLAVTGIMSTAGRHKGERSVSKNCTILPCFSPTMCRLYLWNLQVCRSLNLLIPTLFSCLLRRDCANC